VIALKSPVSVNGSSGFSLTLLRFPDECELEDWKTFFPVVLATKDGNHLSLSAVSTSNAEFFYALPASVTLEGAKIAYTLRMLPLGPSHPMNVELKAGATVTYEDVVLTVKNIVQGKKGREVSFEVLWDTGLPKGDLTRHEKIMKLVKSGNRPGEEDLAFVRSIKDRARRVLITSLSTPETGGDQRPVDSSEITNDYVHMESSVTLPKEVQAKVLSVGIAISLPRSVKTMSADFSYAFSEDK
jgi:hypothetical protein